MEVEELSLAAELAAMKPGPELAVRLAELDPSTLDGYGVVEVRRAWCRQRAYDEAQFLSFIAEAAHCPDEGTRRRERPHDLAQEELACDLTWTHAAAGRQLVYALDLTERLPAVHAALRAGVIDPPKAWVFCDVLRAVEDKEQARALALQVLFEAPNRTTAEIARRLHYLIAKHAPESVKRRTARAVQERKVSYGTDDNTPDVAWLWATGLPKHRVAAAMERVEAFARAARAQGDQRSTQQLQVDTMLDLLEGVHPSTPPVHRRGVVELTVPITTLMGLQDLPGELAGWGPVTADIARQIAAQQHDAWWRATVYSEGGHVEGLVTTRRRPPAHVAARVRATIDRCVMPGCHRPSSRCDLDHQQRWTDGGPTVEENLHPLCRHHHRAKDEYGWTYTMLTPGVYLWTTHTGHQYLVDRRRFTTDDNDDW